MIVKVRAEEAFSVTIYAMPKFEMHLPSLDRAKGGEPSQRWRRLFTVLGAERLRPRPPYWERAIEAKARMADDYAANYDEKVEKVGDTFKFQLKSVGTGIASVKHLPEVRREALEVQLKTTPRKAEVPGDPEVRKEALEVQLRSAARDKTAEQKLEEEREALAKAKALRKVPSMQRGRSVKGARLSMLEMKRRASSLLAMGGVKPSLLKAQAKQREDRGTAEEDLDDEMLGFVTDAHAALKRVLEEQQKQLARLEAKAEQERNAAAKKERQLLLERHLKDKQRVVEARTAEEAERIREQQAEERRQRDAADRAKDARQLCEVIEEIITTEATYLGDLTFVTHQYLRPLRGMLGPQEHSAIFSNLEMMMTLHEKLAEDLRPAASISADDYERRGLVITSAFLKLAPFFKMYAVYSAQYAHVPEQIEAVCKKEASIEAFLAGVSQPKDASDAASDATAGSTAAGSTAAGSTTAASAEDGSGGASTSADTASEADASAALSAALPADSVAVGSSAASSSAASGGPAAAAAAGGGAVGGGVVGGGAVGGGAVGGGAAGGGAAEGEQERRAVGLNQLLFRPVQRMCLYPLLFKQALSARLKLERWDEAEEAEEAAQRAAEAEEAASGGSGSSGGGGGGGGSSGSGAAAARSRELILKLEQVFALIGRTLGTVNEDVRGMEAQQRTMQVLTHKVNNGISLVSPNRVLQHEAKVDMKVLGEAQCCDIFSSRAAAVRRRYKFYAFSDGLLVCRHKEPAFSPPLIRPDELSLKRSGGVNDMTGEFFLEVTTSSTQTAKRRVVTYYCWAEGGDAAVTQLLATVNAMQAATKDLGVRVLEARARESAPAPA